jgi:hypothetical protein
MRKLNPIPVIVYYVLALAISGPFFYWRSILHWKGYHGPNFLKTPSYMWGPGIAGIVCYFLYRHTFKKEITIWGSSLVKSLAIWFGPLLLLAAIGVRKPDGSLDHTTPLIFTVFAFFSIWGEEFGWRWFLQDYLKPMKPLKKYILIGVLWELWHLRFFNWVGDPVLAILTRSILIMTITVLIAILIGLVTDKTKSLFFACTLHGWIDLCSEMPGLNTYITAGVMVALCAYFYFTWDKTKETLTSPAAD